MCESLAQPKRCYQLKSFRLTDARNLAQFFYTAPAYTCEGFILFEKLTPDFNRVRAAGSTIAGG